MIRLSIALACLMLGLTAAAADPSKRGLSRAEVRAIAEREALRSRNNQENLRRLGVGPGAQSQPVLPSSSGGFYGSGGSSYRPSTGTSVVPNR